VEATAAVCDTAAARGTPKARPGFSIDVGRLARWLDEQGVAGVADTRLGQRALGFRPCHVATR